MSASQNHGFLFEIEIRQLHPEMAERPYTDSLDGFDGHSGLSVKVVKGQSNIVACSSPIHFYENTKKYPMIMVIGRWHQVDDSKVYDKVLKININPDSHSMLWNGISELSLREFNEYITSIPYGREAQQDHKKRWKHRRNLLFPQKEIIYITAKIGHGNQRRVQCTINLRKLKDSGIVINEYDDNYLGMLLPYVQKNSPPRILRKKT
jgi:hypothetical protein